MSLLVSPLANLIGSGHSVDSDEFLDFFEIDENTYPRTYIFLKAQKTIFESIKTQISKMEVLPKDQSNFEFIQSFTDKLLHSEFGEVFDNAKGVIPTIRDFINNNKDTAPDEFIKIAQKILSSSIALSRVFSIIAFSLPSKNQTNVDNDPSQNPEKLYAPDMDEVLVLCRICEEYVPLSRIEQHSKCCARNAESRYRIMSVDERIAKLQKSIKGILLKTNWPGTKEQCINVYLPMFHIVMLLNKALQTRTVSTNDAKILSVILSSISRVKVHVLNQNIESMLQKSKELIHEKLKVCIARTNVINDLSPSTAAMIQSPASHKMEVTIADFEVIKRISSGAYARVFLAKKKKTGDIYAIKVIPQSSLKQKNQIQRILNEKDILLQNENPYIVNFYYSIIGFHNLYLVMEYLPGGDLYSLLQNVGSLNEEDTKVYTTQIIMALHSLHKRGIIHRDLKPDNILINESGKLKLTDFGLSLLGNNDRVLSEEDKRVKHDNESLVGTPDYLPPEIILSQPHTFTADYWSLGAVIYELLTGVPPFHRDSEMETFSAIIIGQIDWSELEEFSEEVRSLIKALLDPNPARRLGANGAQEIMDHPWFNSIDWSNLDMLDPPFVPQIQDESSTEYFQERYEWSKTDDGDIIEDIESATSEHDHPMHDEELMDFASIDFKSLSQANRDAANKIRKSAKMDSRHNENGFDMCADDDANNGNTEGDDAVRTQKQEISPLHPS